MSSDVDQHDLRIERRGDATWLTIDRPQKRNALTVSLVRSMAGAIEEAAADGSRAVVVTGAPPAFCAGGDLPELSRVAEDGALAATEVIYGAFHGLVRALVHSPLPTIAAVDGAAMGAGLDLAMACDLRVVTRRSTLASSWIGAGLVPGMGGAFMLPRLVGSARAAEMLLCGDPVDADRAADWGLVNRVVADDGLTAAVDEVVAKLTSRSAVGLARTKASFRRGVDAGLAAELDTLGAVQGALLTAPDFLQVVERFRR